MQSGWPGVLRQPRPAGGPAAVAARSMYLRGGACGRAPPSGRGLACRRVRVRHDPAARRGGRPPRAPPFPRLFRRAAATSAGGDWPRRGGPGIGQSRRFVDAVHRAPTAATAAGMPCQLALRRPHGGGVRGAALQVTAAFSRPPLHPNAAGGGGRPRRRERSQTPLGVSGAPAAATVAAAADGAAPAGGAASDRGLIAVPRESPVPVGVTVAVRPTRVTIAETRVVNRHTQRVRRVITGRCWGERLLLFCCLRCPPTGNFGQDNQAHGWITRRLPGYSGRR